MNKIKTSGNKPESEYGKRDMGFEREGGDPEDIDELEEEEDEIVTNIEVEAGTGGVDVAKGGFCDERELEKVKEKEELVVSAWMLQHWRKMHLPAKALFKAQRRARMEMGLADATALWEQSGKRQSLFVEQVMMHWMRMQINARNW
ncbi:uncharacterized protein MONOS_11330 [Monocercomonoides exilis]|uniref:uncharacterized protein n=1 Tax=Monocercomonoides exilis TaxID=2049356 RepID=UPI00355A574E|nr:hypothetical protein MONOS_11330 [Monocercomonoides exilis]|eukprot:MONOS_11330.1-p1 / transcript=MONOS_11330.1 / gene=MONOS_11330 / organism=Monocercomonoides_exilis_PA203 / gene_product=unspecified product / transcript_product=unspecified product / location=Mono_scaffold00563:23113-23623(-) / protein_length=146 / sequence_SO=supercontig / SO=protein_coding / is_pseudo=false